MNEISSSVPPASALSQKIPLWKQFCIFLKFKAIKVILKMVIIVSLLWAFSGTWLGQQLKPLTHLAYGGVWHIIQKVFLVAKTSGQLSLIIALGLIIFGKPIWKSLYFLIALAFIALGLEYFLINS